MPSTVLRLPFLLLERGLQDLQAWGTRGVESIAFYLGVMTEQGRAVTSLVLAEEPGIYRAPGLLKVTEDWMLELTDLCERREEFVVAHMHSHGISAFHSDTDEHHIFHAPDCVSLVVPNFAQTPDDRKLDRWAAFIGARDGSFLPLDPSRVHLENAEGDVFLLSEHGSRRA